MKITKFWAKGYRSLRDVTLDDLGEFNVFYGPNGSGKSNVLAAIDTFFRLLAIALSTGPFERITTQNGSAIRVQHPQRAAAGKAGPYLTDHDFFGQTPTHEVVLGAKISFEPGEAGAPPPAVGLDGVLDAELTFSRVDRSNPTLTISRLFGRAAGQEIEGENFQSFVAWYCNVLAPRAFGLIDPIRAMPEEKEPVAFDDTQADPVLDEVRVGHIKTALFNAKNSTEGPVLTRYEEMQALMSKALGRPPFHATRDPRTRVIDLYETLPGANRERKVVPIERAGLGIVQVYTIVATILFAQKRAIGVEEPEAHLHAPTTGRQLRQVLDAMLVQSDDRPRVIDQLFIATHSNLFDLDPTGYWDVSMVDGETRVERRPLDQIDARHLYEPGPAKHALAQLLRYAPDDEVVFRRPDDSPVTAREMLRLLQEDDDTAVDFLHNLHGAALRLVRLDARRKESAT